MELRFFKEEVRTEGQGVGGAALGWLAREDKIEIHQEEDELYVSLGVNVYIG